MNIPAYVYFWNRVNGSEDNMINKIDRKKMMSRIITSCQSSIEFRIKKEIFDETMLIFKICPNFSDF